MVSISIKCINAFSPLHFLLLASDHTAILFHITPVSCWQKDTINKTVLSEVVAYYLYDRHLHIIDAYDGRHQRLSSSFVLLVNVVLFFLGCGK